MHKDVYFCHTSYFCTRSNKGTEEQNVFFCFFLSIFVRNCMQATLKYLPNRGFSRYTKTDVAFPQQNTWILILFDLNSISTRQTSAFWPKNIKNFWNQIAAVPLRPPVPYAYNYIKTRQPCSFTSILGFMNYSWVWKLGKREVPWASKFKGYLPNGQDGIKIFCKPCLNYFLHIQCSI